MVVDTLASHLWELLMRINTSDMKGIAIGVINASKARAA